MTNNSLLKLLGEIDDPRIDRNKCLRFVKSSKNSLGNRELAALGF